MTEMLMTHRERERRRRQWRVNNMLTKRDRERIAGRQSVKLQECNDWCNVSVGESLEDCMIKRH